jgi:choline dehydrogenase-like flavoprotein
VRVIGSGWGGSVTALRLTEKGYRVGVLEAGRRFVELPGDVVRRFLWAPKQGSRGIQRIHLLKDVIIFAGSGGGSLVNPQFDGCGCSAQARPDFSAGCAPGAQGRVGSVRRASHR